MADTTVGSGATPEQSPEATGATPEQQGQQPEAGQVSDSPAPEESQKPTGLDTALKAEREARRKAEKELADLRKTSKAGMTEAEQLAKRVQELEQAAAQAKRDAMLQKLGNELSIPPLLLARLQGETEDELRSDATELMKGLNVNPAVVGQQVGGPQGAPTGLKSPEEWLSAIRSKK